MTPPARPRRVVVVGGGIAGVSTVVGLRSGGFDGEVVLVEGGGLPYDRTPLSKAYLAGTADLGALALQPAAWYAEHDVELRTGTTAAALVLPGPDRDGAGAGAGSSDAGPAVRLADGSWLAATEVVLATGGRAARPAVPGADDPRVHVLRTVADADALRDALRPGARVVVVGAGLLGAEVTATALGLGCRVTVVDPEPVPLAPALGPQVAAWLHSRHAAEGATVVAAALDRLEATDDGLRAHLAGAPETAGPLLAEAVLLAVGMAPETRLAEEAGLRVDGGVVVDEGQVTSHPGVLAVGDATRRRVGGVLRPRAEHWDAARQDGERAAATLLGTVRPPETAAWFWSDRHGVHVEAVGRMDEATGTVVRGSVGQPPFAVLGLRDGVVVGAVAVDDPTTVRAARRLVDRRTPVDADRLADPATDLRRLLRGA